MDSCPKKNFGQGMAFYPIYHVPALGYTERLSRNSQVLSPINRSLSQKRPVIDLCPHACHTQADFVFVWEAAPGREKPNSTQKEFYLARKTPSGKFPLPRPVGTDERSRRTSARIALLS
jgi:hypothetical protein